MAFAAIASLFLVVTSGFTPATPRAWRVSAVAMASDSGDLSRRAALAGTMAAVMIPSSPARAFGPETIELRDLSYSDTGKIKGEKCAGRPLVPPGEKVAQGLTPKCVEVRATAVSEAKNEITDAAVFGYVKTGTGDSAIANNPDFRSDAGQFATIDKVPPGENKIMFEFVAVIPDKVPEGMSPRAAAEFVAKGEAELGTLSFSSMKAISYPGGARSATFTECELDSTSDACDEEQQTFESGLKRRKR